MATNSNITDAIAKYGKENVQHALALGSGYKETMPTVEEFIDNPYYLGGAVSVYPFWREHLKKIYPDAYTAPYSTVILYCAIGSGKSTIALIILLYDICRLLKMHDPRAYHELSKVKLLSFALINRTLTLAAAVLASTLDAFALQSPFFSAKLKEAERKEETYESIEVVQASRSGHILGRDVVTALLSEVGFFDTAASAKATYDSAQARIESRFMGSNTKSGMCAGRLILDTSPSDEASFVNSGFIKREGTNKTTYIVTGSIWDIKGHKLSLCGKTFYVFTGDDKTDPRILEDNEQNAFKENPRVISVPTEFRRRFQDDIRLAIQDVAGICTSASTRFFSSVSRIDSRLLNACEQQTLNLRSTDTVDYIVPLTTNPLYIHLDLSLSGDRTGIACAALSDSISFTDTGMPIACIDVVSAFAIKAIDRIPLIGIRDWILSLRDLGHNIAQVSADQFQSASILMELQQLGINTKLLSVDINTSHYENLRYLIGYDRVRLPRNTLLSKELAHLELVKVGKSAKNKIDHPLLFEDGTQGSKDIADAVAGATSACLSDSGAIPSREQATSDTVEYLAQTKYEEPQISKITTGDILDDETWSDF